MKAIYEIVILDNLTGMTKSIFREYEIKEKEEEEIISYLWKLMEGRLRCDCNRYNMFYPDEDSDFPCGEERFKLVSTKRLLEEK